MIPVHAGNLIFVAAGLDPWKQVDRCYTFVNVDMWTEEEGRSDLALEIDLARDDTGRTSATFRGLHVL